MHPRTLLVALLVLAVLGPVATIAASTGDEVDPLVLRPGTGDGAAYASMQGGELTIHVNSTLSGSGAPNGVNARATTRLDGVFTVTNTGEDPCDTWITDGTDGVTAYRSPTDTMIEGSTNAVRIAPGKRMSVGLEVRPNATPPVDLMDELTIKCRTVTEAPPREQPGAELAGAAPPAGPPDTPAPGSLPVAIRLTPGLELADGSRVVTAGDRATLTATTDATVDRFDWSIRDPEGRTTGYTGRSVTRRFDRPGYYFANLTATDRDGAVGRAQIRVLANDRPLVALLTEDPLVAGRPTTLSAAVTNEYGATNVTWRFADGTVVHGPQVRRAFADPGTKRVEITVRDEYGATSTIERQLTVSSGDADSLPVDPGTDDLAILAGSSLMAVGALRVGRRRRGRRRR